MSNNWVNFWYEMDAIKIFYFNLNMNPGTFWLQQWSFTVRSIIVWESYDSIVLILESFVYLYTLYTGIMWGRLGDTVDAFGDEKIEEINILCASLCLFESECRQAIRAGCVLYSIGWIYCCQSLFVHCKVEFCSQKMIRRHRDWSLTVNFWIF